MTKKTTTKDDLDRAVERVQGETIPFERILSHDQAVVHQVANASQRAMFVGGDILVGPAASASFLIMPQLIFRPERIVASRLNAEHFDIIDFRIGRDSQLLTAHPIDAALFAGDIPQRCPMCGHIEQVQGVECLVGTFFDEKIPRFKFDTCNVGQVIRITVHNRDKKESHEMRFALEGKVLLDA